jgi:hypothetical protein
LFTITAKFDSEKSQSGSRNKKAKKGVSDPKGRLPFDRLDTEGIKLDTVFHHGSARPFAVRANPFMSRE